MKKLEKKSDLRIEMVPIKNLQNDPTNARSHKPKSIEGIKRSLVAYGQQKPIVVDRSGKVVAGNGTLLAAADLGWSEIAVVRTSLKGADKTAFAIADNRTAELSEWNREALGAALASLKVNGSDLSEITTGFTPEEMARILSDFQKSDPLEDDEIPEKPRKPEAKKGDLYLLGDHRLLCGDSTRLEDVALVMDGQKADLVSTDPPYIVDYTGDRRPEKNGKKSGKDWSHVYHEIPEKEAPRFYRSLYEHVLAFSKDGIALICWIAHKRIGVLQQVWKEIGILDHQMIVWVKSQTMFCYTLYDWQHEQALIGWKKGQKPKVYSNEVNTSVWQIESKDQSKDHPTSKPIRIFGIPMIKHTKEGAICFEPFSGSGSQIIAAEKLKRRCYAIEIEPVFVDVAVKRWEALTGEKAKKA